jgi:DNA-binding MarR family transcriptional regulator
MDTAAPRFDLEAFLPYQLAVLAGRVSRELAQRYSAEFGLSVAEWRVIAHLSQSGSVSVREIHERVDMDKPKVSRAADRLAARGLISKAPNPADGRLVVLTLTPDGQALMGRLVPVALAYEAEVLGRLPPEGVAPFRAALRGLLGSGG